VRRVYPTVKDFVDAFSPNRRSGFREFVVIEHPREGVYAYGFLTGDVIVEGAKPEKKKKNGIDGGRKPKSNPKLAIVQDAIRLMDEAGIGELQKLLVIFIGSFFQIVLMVAVTVGSTRRDLVEAAYTLGANARGIVRRVLLPSSAPAIAETLRLVLGWAWTYVIVAELIGASSGIGHMITDSQALLNTGQIIFGIILIGIIGLVSDLGFKQANRALYPWATT